MTIQQLNHIFHQKHDQKHDFPIASADRCKMHCFLWPNAVITSADNRHQRAGRD